MDFNVGKPNKANVPMWTPAHNEKSTSDSGSVSDSLAQWFLGKAGNPFNVLGTVSFTWRLK